MDDSLRGQGSVKYFTLLLLVITLAGGVLRYVNITYASLWADELYSMLSVRPGNSWYEILYMQRTFQPPAYFMLLWGWTKVFGFTEFSARLLSVIGGILAIVLSALLGKKVKDERLGIILAMLVAFNPTQILFSIEARFYIFTYCIACCALWLHWHLLVGRPKGFFQYFLLACIYAGVVYFHQFGMFFVFGLFVHDVVVFVREKDRPYFSRKFLTYVLAALFYAPWFFWGILQGLAVKEFWIKEIDIWKYLTFSMGYPFLVNLLLTGLILYFLFRIRGTRKPPYGLFPVVAGMVILLPVLYSYIRVPVLVDRYGMVMAPAIYIMIGMALLWLYDTMQFRAKQMAGPALFGLLLLIPAIQLVFVDRDRLVKQPWREMSAWLKSQADYPEVNVYALGIKLKDRFTIDFYINPEKRAKHIVDMKLGEDEKMYLVETNSVWKINPELLQKIGEIYTVDVVPFQKGHAEFGNVYVCVKKGS